MEANKIQIGGTHYRTDYQHWDFVENNNLGYLEAAATKYITRWRKKEGLRDLEKTIHYIDKLMERHKQFGRMPKCLVDPREIDRFNTANGLSLEEADVVLLLSRWTNLHDLEYAKAKVSRLILDHKRDYPRGFDPVQDVE